SAFSSLATSPRLSSRSTPRRTRNTPSRNSTSGCATRDSFSTQASSPKWKPFASAALARSAPTRCGMPSTRSPIRCSRWASARLRRRSRQLLPEWPRQAADWKAGAGNAAAPALLSPEVLQQIRAHRLRIALERQRADWIDIGGVAQCHACAPVDEYLPALRFVGQARGEV